MIIGFTGTRRGMTEMQRITLSQLAATLLSVRRYNNDPTLEIHHGDCIGADAEFHDICRTSMLFDGAKIIVHPGYSANNPDDRSERAFCEGNEIREPQSHFRRNRNIVGASDFIIAISPCKPMPSSGGTAYTINFARRMKKLVYVIYPDGDQEIFGSIRG